MKKEKRLGNILFWLTLITPFASFALTSAVGEVSIFGIAGIVRYSWIMWLFIPIGILSILIGIKLKKCNQRYKKNFIIAFICLPLLVIFGSYRFIFKYFSYEPDKIIAVENKISLVLPQDVKIATNKIYSYNVSYAKIINNESKVKFENEIKNNHLWQNELSSKIKSILPFDIQYESEAFDRFVFYNITSGEYNTYPSDGEYKCVFVAYDYELKRLIILDDYIIDLD